MLYSARLSGLLHSKNIFHLVTKQRRNETWVQCRIFVDIHYETDTEVQTQYVEREDSKTGAIVATTTLFT